MLKKTAICLFFCLSHLFLYAQRATISNNGTKSLSLGGISATLTGTDAIINNFSNVTNLDKFSAIASSERRFELNELTSAIVGLQMPLGKFGHAGVVISAYGFDEYKEQKISLLYGRKLSENLSISANFDYNTFNIDQFGSKGTFSFGLGASGSLGSGFNFGVYVFNPEKIEIAEASEIPGYIKAGVSKYFSSKISLYTELTKYIDEEMNVSLGIDYQLIDVLNFRIGYNSSPGAICFGIAYNGISNLVIEGGTQYNTILGVTPGITLKYQ